MPTLQINVCGQTATVEFPTNRTLRITAKHPGSSCDTIETYELLMTYEPVPQSAPTGTCVAHRDPLYDNDERCATCWDEFDAAMYR